MGPKKKTMVGLFGFNPLSVVPIDFFRCFKNYLGFLSHKIFKNLKCYYLWQWVAVTLYWRNQLLSCCCVQAKCLGMETKILFSLLWYFQRYLKLWTYFKINIKHKFSCLAMAFGCSPYHRGSTQSSDMAWYWWLTSQNVKNKSSCSWQ